MKVITKHITIRDEELILTNQRAIFWENEDALILSDIHIGKTAHFRRNGIPMPDDILQKDLERLKTLIDYFEVHKLWVVGDLFHAESNVDMMAFKHWISQFEALDLMLIKGNHDSQSRRLMDELNAEVVTEFIVGPFSFIHDHQEGNIDTFTISGHIHPGVSIKGKGKQKIKLPCYQITSNQLILPAFSLFTGLNTRLQLEDVTCYAFTDSSIFEFK